MYSHWTQDVPPRPLHSYSVARKCCYKQLAMQLIRFYIIMLYKCYRLNAQIKVPELNCIFNSEHPLAKLVSNRCCACINSYARAAHETVTENYRMSIFSLKGRVSSIMHQVRLLAGLNKFCFVPRTHTWSIVRKWYRNEWVRQHKDAKNVIAIINKNAKKLTSNWGVQEQPNIMRSIVLSLLWHSEFIDFKCHYFWRQVEKLFICKIFCFICATTGRCLYQQLRQRFINNFFFCNRGSEIQCRHDFLRTNGYRWFNYLLWILC